MRHAISPSPVDLRRRHFLIRLCQGASAATLVPCPWRGFWLPPALLDSPLERSPSGEFHLHPRYRMPLPLDPLLVQTEAGLDEFTSEKYADQIAKILAEWSASLLRSPRDLKAFEQALLPNFSGASFKPAGSQVLRTGPPIEIRRNRFSNQLSLNRDAFLADLRNSLIPFTTILTPEFQVTGIEATHPERSKATTRQADRRGEAKDPGLLPTGSQVATRVRYELVGTSGDEYRRQRVGEWDLLWESSEAGDFRLRTWKTLDETESRCATPAYLDITASALAKNNSYSAQLSRGTDYWRTVLDAACGIDIYGHNGVSIGDIDADGFDDLYVCQPGGLPNRLFRNRGDGAFEDITDAAGVGVIENTACALFVDVTNSGHQDLIVVRSNGPLLFLNDGRGKFRQQASAFRFANPPQGTFTGAAVADYDRDGWLDIYFCLYIYYQGANQYKYPSPYFDANNGPPNFMMRNNRDGTFRDVTEETGLNQNNTRYSFCCAWNDFNRDGWPDLCVVNDFGRKNLYRNNGDGTFTDIAAEAGVEDIGAGMSVCWFDYDNDGSDDLYVANMWTAAGERITMQDEFKKDSSAEVRTLYHKHAMGNSLFHHNGARPQFQDSTDVSGTRIGRWAWSSDSWDFDHDGFPDLYIANGMVSGPSRDDLNSFFWRQVVAKSPDQAKPSHDYEQGWGAINELIRADRTWSGYERNIFYANNGDGTFSDISGAIGLDFIEDGRSFALADFDLDGRQELFLKNRNAPQLRLLKNVLPSLPPSISFRLRGTKSNRDAIGAVITIEPVETQLAAPAHDASPGAASSDPASKPRSGQTQSRTVQAGSGFLAQHSKEVFFGLGEKKGPVRASIRWPSGLVQDFHDLPINHHIWIEEGAAQPVRVEPFRQVPRPRSFNQSVLDQTQGDQPQRNQTSRDPAIAANSSLANPQQSPPEIETWLLAPVVAPNFSLSERTGLAAAFGNAPNQPANLQSATQPDRSVSKRSASLAKSQDRDPEGRTFTLSALRGKPVLLHFGATGDPRTEKELSNFSQRYAAWITYGLQLISIDFSEDAKAESKHFPFPILQGSDDVAAVYNILFRYLFDRHRDIDLPASFLINANGEIVKVYQGPADPVHIEHDSQSIPQIPADRLARALPFPGVTEVTEFGRNYLSFGSVYFQRGYLDQAAAAFETALRDDPESAEALYGIGSVYLNQQKNTQARDCFERALKLRASYPDTLANSWNNLGLIAAREGRLAEAIGDFQEALKLSPDHLIALNNLGSAYRQSKRWDEARQIYERALAIKPTDAEANYGLAMIYAQSDDTAKAEAYLRQALDLRPGYPEALNNLGILYLRTHRRDQAVESFEQSIRVAPDFDQAYLNLARVHAIEGNSDKARAVLQELLKRRPDHATALQMLSQLAK